MSIRAIAKILSHVGVVRWGVYINDLVPKNRDCCIATVKSLNAAISKVEVLKSLIWYAFFIYEN